MRFALLFSGLLALGGGCAGEATRHCSTLAGQGWARMPAPDNAARLLGMQGMPNDPDTLWFAKGDDRRLACIYAGSLTNPGCGAATVYEYAKVEDRWTVRSTAMESCPPQFQ
jgi:hypothetical protein